MDRVIVDTDTAGDDTQALALACLTDRLSVEAVTVVAGSVGVDDDAVHTPVSSSGTKPFGVRRGRRREHESWSSDGEAPDLHGVGSSVISGIRPPGESPEHSYNRPYQAA